MGSSLTEIFKLFDSYSRVARLYPAIITLIPPVLTAVLTTGVSVGTRAALSIAMATAMSTLLANVARSRGKAIEPKLLQHWGGWPTTTMLRYRDVTIERPTKVRYHAALERLCPGLKMPSDADEQQRPDDADQTYRSATRRLIELRRDESYKLLHKENASYGFRRNLLGLKAAALGIIATCLVWTAGAIALEPVFYSWQVFAADIGSRPPMYIAAASNVLAAVFWCVVVRRGFVHQSALEYSHALLRTLEEAPARSRKPAKAKT